MKELTHASFFSGSGGTDLGLEAAGWRTVSFSEIDPYASAVLAERWPGVPNLGDITRVSMDEAEHVRDGDAARDLATAGGTDDDGRSTSSVGTAGSRGGPATGTVTAGVEPENASRGEQSRNGSDWRDATLWSGGFPCQDLSVAGKRAGFTDGKRSVLAFAFLDLVAAYRPPLVLLENVPGLLSSNNGRDFLRLVNAFQELRYVGFYRTLDAQFFGVPQRRKRVFILAIDAFSGLTVGSARQVLSVGARCERHPETGGKAGPGTAESIAIGLDLAGSITKRYGKGVNTTVDDGGIVIEQPGRSTRERISDPRRREPSPGWLVGDGPGRLIGAPPDPGGVREADGLAGRSHHSDGLEIATPITAGYHKGAGTNDGRKGKPQNLIIANAISTSAGHPGHSSPRGDGSDNLVAEVVGALRVGGATVADGGRGDVVPVIPVIAPTLTAPDRTRRIVDGKRQDGSRLDRIPTVTQALPTTRVGTDDNDAQAGFMTIDSAGYEDELLPEGLDGNRYRCCGNGVVAPVASWLGTRLAWLAAQLPDEVVLERI
jgi:site-specific DNA-cytosine methylase